MSYVLGIDVGTTFTAAAVMAEDRAEIVQLGLRAASIPSVVFIDGDTVLTGDAAVRRGVRDPNHVAREFKRRFGDPVPLLIGSAPLSAESVFASLVRATVEAVVRRQGGDPDAVAVTHPANWGPYKLELLRQALEMADLGSASTLTEPEAAAIQYASLERVPAGDIVAVYDLGGGTFDAAVLAKTDDGFHIMGSPAGVERLGGVDFDQAVVAHVARAVAPALDDIDQGDAALAIALARLHQECVEAKEVLWADTETSIPVSLPGLETEVRLTRAELEAMIRLPLGETISCMRRALRSAGVEPDELAAFLLVGGSSRIPLVAEMVHAEFGRRVAVDADPKHVVALGAARAAAMQLAPAAAGGSPRVAPSVGHEMGPLLEHPTQEKDTLVLSPALDITGPTRPDGDPVDQLRGTRRRRMIVATAIGAVGLGLGAVALASPWDGGRRVDTKVPDPTTTEATVAPATTAPPWAATTTKGAATTQPIHSGSPSPPKASRRTPTTKAPTPTPTPTAKPGHSTTTVAPSPSPSTSLRIPSTTVGASVASTTIPPTTPPTTSMPPG